MAQYTSGFNMKKDFLFIDYSWVENSRLIFNMFASEFSCDIVDETNLQSFKYADDYRYIVLYLHDDRTIKITNYIISLYPNAKLIQHDDTDFEDIQIWTDKKPDLVMQRELTPSSKNPWGCPVRPHHFPMPSLREEVMEKDIDVFFMGCLTNSRRRKPFLKMLELAEGPLKHLNWKLLLTPINQRTPELFKNCINKCKIGLNCYGNSYDSHRIWQLASCGVCTIMPKPPLLSIQEEHNHYKDYIECKEDFSDLQEKIEFALRNDNWRKIGNDALNSYELNHNPRACYEKYKSNIRSVFGQI